MLKGKHDQLTRLGCQTRHNPWCGRRHMVGKNCCRGSLFLRSVGSVPRRVASMALCRVPEEFSPTPNEELQTWVVAGENFGHATGRWDSCRSPKARLGLPRAPRPQMDERAGAKVMPKHQNVPSLVGVGPLTVRLLIVLHPSQGPLPSHCPVNMRDRLALRPFSACHRLEPTPRDTSAETKEKENVVCYFSITYHGFG